MRQVEIEASRRRSIAEIELADLARDHPVFGADGESAATKTGRERYDFAGRDTQIGIEIFEQGDIE